MGVASYPYPVELATPIRSEAFMSLPETSDNEEEAPLSQESSMPIAPTGSERRALANEFDGTRWAHGMEFSQLEALAGYVRVQEAMPGDIVVAEGDRASFLCWITAGRVGVQKRGDDGTPHALATLGRGDRAPDARAAEAGG